MVARRMWDEVPENERATVAYLRASPLTRWSGWLERQERRLLSGAGCRVARRLENVGPYIPCGASCGADQLCAAHGGRPVSLPPPGELSTRTRNSLKRAGLLQHGDAPPTPSQWLSIARLDDAALLMVRNLGIVGLAEVRAWAPYQRVDESLERAAWTVIA